MTILDKISEIIGKIGQGGGSQNQPTPKNYAWHNGQEDFNVSNENGGKVIFDFTRDRGTNLIQRIGAITADGVALIENDQLWTCPDKFEIEFTKTFNYTGVTYSSTKPAPHITVICYK